MQAGDAEHASAVAKAELLGSATGSASLVTDVPKKCKQLFKQPMLGPVRVK